MKMINGNRSLTFAKKTKKQTTTKTKKQQTNKQQTYKALRNFPSSH